jgi:hypothetical protein
MTLTGDTTNWNNTANGPFYIVIDAGLATEEKILVTARTSGNITTMTRGQDGTTAAAHAAGAVTYPIFTATDADQANKIASALTTKGDVLGTDGSTLNRLAVGTNDYALLADSAATNGFSWKQIPAAGLATDSVTTVKIVDANVTAAKLATDAVTKAKIADRSIGSAELDGISINAGTTSAYTLVAGDANRVVTFSATTTVTIPASVFSVGDQINILQTGTGQVTIAGPGVTLRSESSRLKTRAQYAMATVICIASNEFVVLGNVVA